jgi:DNA-binding transcriptional regulator YhcF (GntR family)
MLHSSCPSWQRLASVRCVHGNITSYAYSGTPRQGVTCYRYGNGHVIQITHQECAVPIH